MTDPVPTIAANAIPADALILDVREPDEWAAGHIAEAVSVPMGSVLARASADPDFLRPAGPLIITCKAGGRAGQVAAWLVANGFPAHLLEGGMSGWHANGRPMVSDTGLPPTVR